MKFHQRLFKILKFRKHNVMDVPTDGRSNGQCENSIPTSKHSLLGHNMCSPFKGGTSFVDLICYLCLCLKPCLFLVALMCPVEKGLTS